MPVPAVPLRGGVPVVPPVVGAVAPGRGAVAPVAGGVVP